MNCLYVHKQVIYFKCFSNTQIQAMDCSDVYYYYLYSIETILDEFQKST